MSGIKRVCFSGEELDNLLAQTKQKAVEDFSARLEVCEIQCGDAERLIKRIRSLSFMDRLLFVFKARL